MKRILIVDDEPHILEGLRHLLRGPDRDIAVVGGAKAALQLLEARRFDLLITDVMMPEMSGFDLLAALRTRDAIKLIPVIILTAKGEARDAETARQVWNATVVAKPFKPAELRELVTATLNPSAGTVQAVPAP